MTTEEISVHTAEVNPTKARIPPKRGRCLSLNGRQGQPSPRMGASALGCVRHTLALSLLRVSW